MRLPSHSNKHKRYLPNGTQKSGTHALRVALQTFDGLVDKVDRVEHLPEIPDNLKDRLHIHIIRNPRNIMFSYLRWTNLVLNRDNILAEIPRTIARCNDFVHYLKDPDLLTVRFELLLSDPTEIQRIADYIGKPLVDGHFKSIWRKTNTFTGRLSNWRDYWTPEINKIWRDCGGLNLEDALEYNPHIVYKRQANG